MRCMEFESETIHERASWFETRGAAALLTMRVQDLFLRMRVQDFILRRRVQNLILRRREAPSRSAVSKDEATEFKIF
jgi:hypothetical protein